MTAEAVVVEVAEVMIEEVMTVMMARAAVTGVVEAAAVVIGTMGIGTTMKVEEAEEEGVTMEEAVVAAIEEVVAAELWASEAALTGTAEAAEATEAGVEEAGRTGREEDTTIGITEDTTEIGSRRQQTTFVFLAGSSFLTPPPGGFTKQQTAFCKLVAEFFSLGSDFWLLCLKNFVEYRNIPIVFSYHFHLLLINQQFFLVNFLIEIDYLLRSVKLHILHLRT